MDTRLARQVVEEHLAMLRKKLRSLKEEMAQVESEISAGNVFLGSIGRESGDGAVTRESRLAIGGRDVAEELAGSRTIHDAMVRFARLSGNALQVKEAADAIRRVGLTDAKHVAPMLYRQIDRHREQWHKVKAGLYLLKEDDPPRT